MSRYAEGTSVSVAQSRTEIESIITRYGASRFASMTESGRAMIMFEAHEKRVMFELPLPPKTDFSTRKKYGKEVEADPVWTEKQWEQACRQRWRALGLVVKAKLEAVAAGITDFESEFLAHIVLPNGKTVGTWFKGQLDTAYANNKMPPMLGSGKS